MAIIKAFGIEIRTGKDQVGHSQPIRHESTGPQPIPLNVIDAEPYDPAAPASNSRAVAIHQPQQQSRQHLPFVQPKPRNDYYLTAAPSKAGLIASFMKDAGIKGVRFAMPTGASRAALSREICFPAPPEFEDRFDVEIYKACILKFKKMMESGNHFSICDFDKVLELSMVSRAGMKKAYDFLHSQHCKHWDDMDSETTDLIYKTVNYIFTEGRSGNPAPGIVEDLIKDL